MSTVNVNAGEGGLMWNRRQVLMHGMGLVAASWLAPNLVRAESVKRPELTLLNWPDYLDGGVIAAFEKQRGIKVRQVFFDSDAERDQFLVKKGGESFDLMVVNRLHLPFYVKQGWVVPVDKAALKNFGHLDPRWIAEPDESGRLLGIPYFWGTMGLAYREDLMPTPPASWMDFFRPMEVVRGRIQALESDRELLGMALKALGHSVNTEDNAALTAAESLLQEQKPHVKTYRYTDLNAEAPLVTGEVWMAMIFNGDALKLQEFNPSIRYVQPREGTVLWVDDLALGKGKGGRELALAFLDFLLDPAMAVRNAESLHFATPNRAALQQATREYLNNPNIFPSEELLSHSETVRLVGARTQRRINDIVSRLMK
ncbi:MAG: spermidine/putrescine ABC transporter substrate-binding protein [Magnetococcales bacterium]|nr:spermidine/putrescine ABC transporter substrate-binding protein [Magnetococcales bacterium]NGZ04794.1 spermidine/putrescine ABC transporter substrate-binding protein [Magnetococcales bacterium]